MAKKKTDSTSAKAQDEAAAEIQGAAAGYLAKMRADKAEKSAAEDPGIIGGIVNMFSNRDPKP